MKRLFGLGLAVMSSVAGAQHDSGMGTVRFPNTGSATAQGAFLRGVAQLHSFAYRESAESFQAAEHADPRFALPYWLEASTFRHGLWSEEDVASARAALARLAPNASARLAKAGNAKERAYGAAVEALFADADEPVRARAYADSMRSLARAYPRDLEVVAFASVAIMGADRFISADEAQQGRIEAESLATKVFREAPNHPGGAHYLIHAVDYPSAAPRGLAAARAYSKIAPALEHALHMPAHIFLQMGMWDDVVASNEQGWKASREMVARDHLPATALTFHGLTWLQYGYLEQGKFAAAKAIIDTARNVLRGTSLEGNDRPDARYAICELSFRYAMETGDWASWAANTANDPGSHESTRPDPSATARTRTFANGCLYQRAVVALMNGNLAPADSAAALFKRLYESVPAAVRPTMRGAAPGVRATQLAALLARARGDTATAVRLLRESMALEATIPALGPPQTLISAELLGDYYLAAGNAAEAQSMYAASLEAARGRTAAARGLAKAKARLAEKRER